MDAFVIVEVAAHKVALPAREVEQVLRMVALTPVPRAHARLDGVLDLHGELVPVLSLRACFDLPRREPSPDAHLVILQSEGRRVALHVDRVVDLAVVEREEVVATTWTGPGGVVSAAVRLPGGVAVVPRPDAFAVEGGPDP